MWSVAGGGDSDEDSATSSNYLDSAEQLWEVVETYFRPLTPLDLTRIVPHPFSLPFPPAPAPAPAPSSASASSTSASELPHYGLFPPSTASSTTTSSSAAQTLDPSFILPPLSHHMRLRTDRFTLERKPRVPSVAASPYDRLWLAMGQSLTPNHTHHQLMHSAAAASGGSGSGGGESGVPITVCFRAGPEYGTGCEADV